MILFTIGFARKSLREFIDLLRAAGVDSVVDVRLRNTSQLAGYAKRDDLAFILEAFDIGYLEEPRLAPTDVLLDTYRSERDWNAYVPDFEALLATRPLGDVLDRITARFEHPCLLCAEPEPDRCHRRLVAEAFARLQPGLEVHHLVAKRKTRNRPLSTAVQRADGVDVTPPRPPRRAPAPRRHANGQEGHA